MRDWIRTAERLPEPHVSVLVWFEGGEEHFDVAWFDPDARFGPPDNPFVGSWVLPHQGFDFADCDPDYWIPLPPAPEDAALQALSTAPHAHGGAGPRAGAGGGGRRDDAGIRASEERAWRRYFMLDPPARTPSGSCLCNRAIALLRRCSRKLWRPGRPSQPRADSPHESR